MYHMFKKQEHTNDDRNLNNEITVEETREERIRTLLGEISELKKNTTVSVQTGAFSINLGEEDKTEEEGGEKTHKIGGVADEDVSSLGTALTASVG